MFYLLTDYLKNWLDQSGLFSVVRVFLQLEFRAFLAVLVAFAVVVLLGKPVIRWLRRQKVGDAPEFYNERLNEMMKGKSGTPTMGGIIIIGAILLTTFLLADFVHNRLVHLAVLVMVWLAAVGSFDDWLKLTAARRGPGTREGLYAWEKLLFQLGMASLVCYFLYRHGLATENPAALSLNLPFQRTYVPVPKHDVILQQVALQLNPGVWVLAMAPFVLIGTVAIAGMSNAVNITDGMDGLAAGTMTIAAFAMMTLCYIASQQSAASFLLVPHVADAKELMVITGAMAGACLGFLWFNCNPASVFMGDTGSLSLGGLLAYVAVAIRQEFLLVLIGGIFVMEIGSVIMQVSYFKWTKGKRIFRCSPIHHHFHMGGLSELQVVTRFWIVAIIFAMLALVSIKLR
ncbi:MAG: phospho-N-acetylmuramoyl-pentapeptide-transferase [Phycisphaerae bacterium]|jgi:phospho-N-acetylmuramoyl-pentapeptide-transferase|nr:phospho-N-acetylmuramoyl-pentapeptide-transferase [Phycisphaerae bacterium]